MNLTGARKGEDVRVWLSVFFGNPNPQNPQLDYACLDATISDEVLVPKPGRNSVPSRNQLGSSFKFSDAHRLPLEQQKLSEDMRIFRVIEDLSLSFNEDILCRLIQECPVCEKAPVKQLVHRPLSATRNGYVELQDSEHVRKLMGTIASHVVDAKDENDVKSRIGCLRRDRPYVCTLAVPVCALNSKCHRIIDEQIQRYVNGILDGSIEPKPLQGDCDKSSSSKRISPNSEDSRDWLTESFDWLINNEEPEDSFDANKGEFYDVGNTVFVGRPRLQVEDTPTRGQLSCLAYTSKWPISVIPNANKDAADIAADYRRIAALHEPDILNSAKYRCAVCPELVPAKTLLHRPLAFYKSNADGSLERPLRTLVMNLFQYIEGRWKYPETSAALGYKDQAHVFDFVVPICDSGTICEETARTAVREFIQLLSPKELQCAFPGLYPDSDFCKYEKEESFCDRRTVKNPVKKIGPVGLMTEKADRGEDPMSPELTITKLRHWYEMCIAEEEAQKEYGRNGGDMFLERKKTANKTKGEPHGKIPIATNTSDKNRFNKKKSGRGNNILGKNPFKKSKTAKVTPGEGSSEVLGEADSDNESVVRVDRKPDNMCHTAKESQESVANHYSEANIDSNGDDDASGDELVWVYSRDDNSGENSFDDEEGNYNGHDERRIAELVETGVERQLLFRPLLTLDFWLLCEATNAAHIGDTPERAQSEEMDDNGFTNNNNGRGG